MSTTYIGLDPGKTGFVGVLTPTGPALYPIPADPVTLMALIGPLGPAAIAVEKVGPSPRQGSSAAFSFGRSAQLAESVGRLYAASRGCIYLEPRPQQWKARFGLIRPDLESGRAYRENKAAAARLARELFPTCVEITHESADALLLAEFARRESARSLHQPSVADRGA